MTAPHEGAWNMAADSALLESVQDGAPPVLRLYTWSPACLSFGRNQPALGLYDEAEAARRGIDIVRRPTGGLAVLHHHEITYAVAAPIGLLGGLRDTYGEINRALVNGLRRLGVEVALATRQRMPAVAAAARTPCFHEPATGEVVAGGHKLVGSAQRRERNAVLQHGSILVDGDQSAVLELQHLPTFAAAAAGGGATSLRALLGRVPSPADVATAIIAGFEARCGIRLAPTGLSRRERVRAQNWLARYRSSAWTWRR